MFDQMEEKDSVSPVKAAVKMSVEQKPSGGGLSGEAKEKLDSLMAEAKQVMSDAGVEDPKEVVEQYFGDEDAEAGEVDSGEGESDFSDKKSVAVAMLKKKALGD